MGHKALVLRLRAISATFRRIPWAVRDDFALGSAERHRGSHHTVDGKASKP